MGLASVVGSGRSGRKVLLVDLDDIGWDLLRRVEPLGVTPRITALMATGRVWSHFWAAPNCSLFRARVLTGADAYRPENYVGGIVKPLDTFAGPAGPWLPDGLPGARVKIGKWHMSGGAPAAMFPDNLIDKGWTRFVGCWGNPPEDGGTGYYGITEYDVDASGVIVTQQPQHQTTRCASLALAEIAAGTELIHASFCAVHKPFESPPDGEPAGKVYTGTTDAQIKLDMLYHLDHWLGVVVDEAVKQGYVVIVACDNGTSELGKNTYHETGSNTPLFAVGAGVVPGVSERLVAATDLWATVRRIRGGTGAAPDSVDFADDMLGWPSVAREREFLTLDWYPAKGIPPTAGNWSRMIRDARWKYVDQKQKPAGTSGDKVVALFDLLTDPGEAVNLLDAPLSSEAQAAYDLLLANLPT